MKRLKTDELSKLSRTDLITRLNDLRSELSTLRSKAARGTLKKELGEIKTVRRNIARINTAIRIERIASNSQTGNQTKQSESQESKI
ncbi:MAG: 50S ribosomal protein L29 [archaeon]|nr:50S ribosomal protein L29 [archaeon]